MKSFTDQNASNLAPLSVFSQFLSLRCVDLHLKHDESSNMLAIIAIHSTHLGPALGGCRFRAYPSIEHGIIDAIRLAHGMSYKAAISNLPFGGGKAVIIQTPQMTNRTEIFRSFGQFVQELGGRYITAEDSGTGVEDMDVIRTVTPFVTGNSSQKFICKDPSPLTAIGVRRGIQAAVKHHLHRDTLAGIHVAICGAGHVGYYLAKELHQLGARLTITDIKPETTERCADEFHATPVSPQDIHKVESDVYAPCALSNAVSFENIDEINAKIIAGSANNQLESPLLAERLMQKGILYAPDYVINAGGLIHVAAQYNNQTENMAKENIENIYNTLLMLFERAAKENVSPLDVANRLAEQRLYFSN
ncbi:MAG: Glu/Leu/Phe/Val dehydrogenase [Proteobacteria bacterium]|nr:Glu/Leu/Phe/Val dehydrogenase [Pseudomonadota bacterium]